MIKRRDTPENRAFWEYVEQTAAYVRSHAMCFSNFCCVQDGPCPKANASEHEGSLPVMRTAQEQEPRKMSIGGVIATQRPNGEWTERCPECGRVVTGSEFKLQQHNRWCLGK